MNLRNEFTDALLEVKKDWERDGVIYLDPKVDSDTVIATKVRLALELSDGKINVRRARYPSHMISMQN